MNYYERHIGDYLKDTSHLSLLEHGIYTRLLDVYYTREGALPADQVARLIGARTKDEREAMQAVLGEFFKLVDGAWKQDRCEREITRFQDKQRKAKASAEARWSHTERNANASPNAMRTHSEGNAPNHQTPDTIKKGRAVDDPPPQARPVEIENPKPENPASEVCKALRSAGLPGVNASHPELLALLAQGVTVETFAQAAAKAVDKRKGFAYLLGVVRGQLQDAAAIREGPGVQAAPWDSTRSGIEAMAEKLGLGRWNEKAFNTGTGEAFSAYESRVRKAHAETLEAA